MGRPCPITPRVEYLANNGHQCAGNAALVVPSPAPAKIPKKRVAPRKFFDGTSGAVRATTVRI